MDRGLKIRKRSAGCSSSKSLKRRHATASVLQCNALKILGRNGLHNPPQNSTRKPLASPLTTFSRMINVCVNLKRRETGRKLVLFTNSKSHTGFRSVPKSVTLSDLERPNGRHYALFDTKLQLSMPNCVKFTEAHTHIASTTMGVDACYLYGS